MKCNVELTKLIDLVYGELETGERNDLDTHVRTCSKCSRQVASLKEFGNCLSTSLGKPVDATSPADAIMTRLGLQRRALPAFRRPVWAAAALVMMVSAVLMLMRTHVNPPTVRQVAEHKVTQPAVKRYAVEPRRTRPQLVQKPELPKPRSIRRKRPETGRVTVAKSGDGSTTRGRITLLIGERVQSSDGVVKTEVTVVPSGTRFTINDKVSSVTLTPPEDAESIERPLIQVVKVPIPDVPGGQIL